MDTNLSKFQYSIHDAELRAQEKVGAVISIITEQQSALIEAQRKEKDSVYISAYELESQLHTLINLIGSISGDLTNAYAALRLQSVNSRLTEDIENRNASKIAREVWQLVDYKTQEAKKQNAPLTVER